MSKKSRTFQPPASSSKPAADATPAEPGATGIQSAAATPAGRTQPVVATSTTPAGSTSSATSRAAARRRAAAADRTSAPPSFFERYRVLIVGAIAVALVAVTVAVVANMSGTSASAYDCASLLTPGPTDPIPTPPQAAGAGATASTAPGSSPAAAATPAPEPTQRLGFTTQDLGRGHVTTSTHVSYDYCPPASGQHYNIGGRAPLARQFYPPSTAIGPGNWVHNLEHGYVVLLYKGNISSDVQQQLQAIMAEATPSAISGATCGYSKVIAARFDDMDPNVNFAAVAWDRALLLDQFDKQALLTFVNQWQDGPQTPESGLC